MGELTFPIQQRAAANEALPAREQQEDLSISEVLLPSRHRGPQQAAFYGLSVSFAVM